MDFNYVEFMSYYIALSGRYLLSAVLIQRAACLTNLIRNKGDEFPLPGRRVTPPAAEAVEPCAALDWEILPEAVVILSAAVV